MTAKGLFRKKLEEVIRDADQLDQICRIYEEINEIASQDRRKRQKEGIKEAKKKGKVLGRPKIKEPDNFSIIVEAWEANRIPAVEGARACGMGLSTFYRRIRDRRDEALNLEGSESYAEK